MSDKINLDQVKDLILDDNIIASLNEISNREDVMAISVSRDIHYCNDIPVGTLVESTKFNGVWLGMDIGCGVSSTKLPKGTIDKLANVDFTCIKGSNKLGMGIGTLGNGNHFIEFGYDKKDNEFVTIHTGSRSYGAKIHDIIIENIPDETKYNLYLQALDFAKENHLAIINKLLPELKIHNITVRHHNYVLKHNNNYLHMKGSMYSQKNILYPIPANMRDGVYHIIAMRDGIHLPHGAGRICRRREALDKFTEEDVKEQTNHLLNEISFGNRDELPSVYKNIDDVLNPLVEQGLIKIVNVIKPVICIKN